MALALAAPRGASADDGPYAASGPDPEAPAPPSRRSGFILGVDVGPGVASIAGFPNDLNKIGYASWYTVTGARPAATLEIWAGVAIVDWFSVSLGFKGSSIFDTGSLTAKSLGGVMRLEGFPLWPLGGAWRDLGVRFDAGLGAASVSDASGNTLVDGGSASILGGGVFWEGLRAWKTAHGPFLMGDYTWSASVRRPGIFLGWRSVLYAGRVTPSK